MSSTKTGTHPPLNEWPEWANYWASDHDGFGFFYEHEPVPDERVFCINPDVDRVSNRMEMDGYGIWPMWNDDNWQDSLVSREGLGA